MEMDLKLILILYRRRNLKRLGNRNFWVHPLNLLRPTLGEHLKIELMHSKYPRLFFEYTRLSPVQFDKLLSLIEPTITKEYTNYREPVPARIRLMVTLRFLATGDSFRTISTNYCLGRSTIAKIVWETTDAIWKCLHLIYLKAPTEEDWIRICEEFETLWNFPNCLAAIDGKHVMIEAPCNSGSLFYNYKGYFSIVLLATCDAKYRFTAVDIGAYGRQSDGGIFSNSQLGQQLLSGTLPIPSDRKIASSNLIQPCTFVGDEAFSLSTFMMRPYPGVTNRTQRIFNYRLSRARRIIENVFGILSHRFRVYHRKIKADYENLKKIVQATVVLHNFIMTDKLDEGDNCLYCPPGFVDTEENDGHWREQPTPEGLQPIKATGSNNYTKNAKNIRDKLPDYFITSGSVKFQEQRACLSANH